LSLVARFVRHGGWLEQIASGFTGLRKSRKGQPVDEVFKQLIDGMRDGYWYIDMIQPIRLSFLSTTTFSFDSRLFYDQGRSLYSNNDPAITLQNIREHDDMQQFIMYPVFGAGTSLRHLPRP
jgi:hypothetical protein